MDRLYNAPSLVRSLISNIANQAILSMVQAMPTRNVNLTNHLDSFVEARVSSGRFSNASEVVREGLRLLEQQEAEDKAKLEWLRAVAQDTFAAIERGEGMSFESMDELAILSIQLAKNR